MFPEHRIRHRLPAIALLALATLTTPAIAQPLPGSVDIEDLERTKDWVLEVDGEEVPGAQIYYSDYEVAWLVTSPRLGSLMLSPRGNSVQRVDGKALRAKSKSSAGLDGGSTLEQVTTYSESQRIKTFELDGRVVTLKPAPPLLGYQSFAALEERHPDFEEKARSYSARAPALAAKAAPLAADRDDVVVRVYFGSWSPYCERVVPKIIGVEKAWQHVRFEYYGLPQEIPEDELAKEHRITGVPTVVVSRDGEEVERFMGRQLDEPAELLEGVLGAL